MFPIVKGFVNFCWSIFKWVLLLGVAGGAVVAAYLFHRFDEAIRCRVEDRFAQHYRDLKVTVRSAALVEGKGIEVRGLSVVEPGAAGPRADVLHLEEVFLTCRTDLKDLASGEPEVSRIVLRRPTLRVTRRPDGTWSAAKLLPFPRFGSRPPEMIIENGTIEVFDPLKQPSGLLTLREVNLRVTPIDEPRQTVATPRRRKVQGTLSGDFVRQVEVDGTIDVDSLGWEIQGSVEGLDVSPEMRNALPGDLASRTEGLGSLRGLAQVGFWVAYDPEAESPYRFELRGDVTRGRLDHAQLPHPLVDLSARFRVDKEGVSIEGLSALSGPSTIQVHAFRLSGFDPRCPMTLDAAIADLELNDRLRSVLPAPLCEVWDQYAPAGRVHARLKLECDGKRWTPQLVAVDCIDLAFAHHKFPYRLKNATGWLRWENDRLALDLTAYGGSRPVRIWGEVDHPTSEPTFTINARGDDLAFDKPFFDALRTLPGKAHEVVVSLRPRGTFDFSWQMRRAAPQGPVHKHLQVGLSGGSIRYDKFPYPLGNVRGLIEMNDDEWTFRNLTATNDTGTVTCRGHLVPCPEGHELVLRFTGSKIPLREELRDALGPSNMRQLWNDLKLQGVVDLPEVVMRHRTGDPYPEIRVLAEPVGQTTSIEPVWLPYRLENVSGTFEYGEGRVRIGQFRAEHDRTRLSAAVDCRFLADGRWTLHAEQIWIDQLDVDHDLLDALPGDLQETARHLNPTGPINIHRGTLDLSGGEGPTDEWKSHWDLPLVVTQGGIDCGIPLRNISGGVRLVGAYDGRSFYSHGELDLDSLTCKDVQITQVRGPIQLHGDRLLLGASIAGATDAPPRELTASVFGGALSGSGWVALREGPRYDLQLDLTRADLGRCAYELTTAPQKIRGIVSARARLGGTGTSLKDLGGYGRIEIREADIYELPLMIALLKILSIREPDRTAFRTSDVDFQIQGGHVYVQNITFNGDAISLEGSGMMELDTSIRLTFRAIPGRREWQLPLFGELLSGASEQIMVIHVGGTLSNPIRRREPFPGVQQALQQLGAELQRTTGAPPLFPQAGQRTFDTIRPSPLLR